MALALLSPAAHSLPRPRSPPPIARTTTTSSSIGFSFFSCCFAPASDSCSLQRASSAGGGDGAGSSEPPGASSLDADLLRRVSGAADAGQALDIVVESVGGPDAGTGSLDASDCNAIVAVALDRGNVDLALSVFEAMRSGFARVGGWRWARPDVRTYALLVQRLAAALRVSDAIRIIDYVSRAGVSSAEEVPFGMIVRCPTCRVAVAVAQPQHGTQVVSCSKCRYQYELFSGDITSIESEEVSMDISALEKTLRFINVMKDGLPAAVHSIVLPQKAVDIVVVRQQLLSQYDMLQTRLKDLKQLAEKEVWMLARMCQLENKILVVGEPSYRARQGRVKRVRERLESTLLAKIELMESYAKLCSMIEIEVEMDSDVIVAEAASSAERISEQIQQLMEIDSLEEQWRIQAEANDEAERLLSSDSLEALSAEHV